jgi:hypothetical protein
MNYETIKQLAREVDGVRIADLCALAPNNDPFYTGRPSEVAAAEWFAGLWERFSYTTGVHLRRVHYRIVSQDPPVLRPDGTPYENTLKDWAYLGNAGKWARYLRLVDPEAFVDRRNPEAIIFANWQKPGGLWYDDPTPRYGVEYDPDEWDGYTMPQLPALPELDYWLPDLPAFEVEGYTGVQQDYHVEVWCEKTTMNDVLKPLCNQYGANLVTGAGEMSITAVVDFMNRVREAERQARILYVSDYDPAGVGMPISVARKIEFFQRVEGHGDLDIRLQPIVLTVEQVGEYDLPRVPVKDSDRRKANWEAHHGQGQVELDALEALHEGVLAAIVGAAILDHYDPRLVERARERREELKQALAERREAVIARFQDEQDELDADYRTLRDDFQQAREEFDRLVAGFQERIDGYQEQMGSIQERGRELYEMIHDGLDDVDVDVADYPLPEPALPPESNGTLYASERDYLDQLVAYKAYRQKGEIG